jgi:sortase A
MRRRKASTILVVVGLLLIIAALALTGYNLWENYRAGKNAQTVAEKLEGDINDGNGKIDPNMEMPVKMIKGKKYIGVLEMPTLNLMLPVLSEWSYPNLKLAPCRYTGSAYESNMVIAAHNYLTHFGRLKELNIGDTIIFKDMDGNRFVYEVYETEILQPTDIDKMKDGGYDLTLFTCTIGGKTRYTVRCMLQEY